MKENSNKTPIGKIRIEIYPELISSTSKAKKLDVCAVWFALKAIDAKRNGSGKFKLETVLDFISGILKSKGNYSYTVFKKGVGCFWKDAVGRKGNKYVYLLSMDKVVNHFSFEIAKTAPFIIRMEELTSLDSSNEVKAYLSSFVIARYGQNKPIAKSSLQENLGVSESTVNRRIALSNVSVKPNYCFADDQFDNLLDAYNYLKKRRGLEGNSLAWKIIKQGNKFVVAKQIGNSYSAEDYSRGKISKRPRAFRIIDSENKETFTSKKFYYQKNKISSNKETYYSKIKKDYTNYHVWKLCNLDEDTKDTLEETISSRAKARSWKIAKREYKNQQEC